MPSIPRTSGIYCITCTVTGKIYIGSAINLCIRWRNHFNELQRNDHNNPKLQRAWNKYGPDAFTFKILELVLPMSLTAREQYWFKKLKPFGNKGFNIARVAGSSLGRKMSPEAIEKNRQSKLGKKASPETREKMRVRMLGNTINRGRRGRKLSPEAIDKLRQATVGNKRNLGKKHTPEARARMSQAAIGNKHALGTKASPERREKIGNVHRGKKLSPEHRERNRQANLGRKHNPEVYASRRKTFILTSPDGTEYVVSDLRKFCQEHHLNNSHIIQVAKGKAIQHKGWKARYP